MAYEIPLHSVSIVAGEDLSAAQFKFVKISAGAVIVCTGATDKPLGVLQNKPTSGQAAEVMTMGTTKVQADAALTIGDSIGSSADGQAAAYVQGTDTTKYIVGIVLTAATAAAGFATAVINCPSAARGA